MSKVTIEKVFSDEKETKFGKRTQLSIKVKESTVKDINGTDVSVAGKYIRGFFPQGFIAPFKEGDETEILLVQKGEFLNFNIPGVGKPPAPDTSNLVDRIAKLEAAVFGGTVVPEPEEAVDPDNF